MVAELSIFIPCLALQITSTIYQDVSWLMIIPDELLIRTRRANCTAFIFSLIIIVVERTEVQVL